MTVARSRKVGHSWELTLEVQKVLNIALLTFFTQRSFVACNTLETFFAFLTFFGVTLGTFQREARTTPLTFLALGADVTFLTFSSACTCGT